jgi:hypothetical protein
MSNTTASDEGQVTGGDFIGLIYRYWPIWAAQAKESPAPKT